MATRYRGNHALLANVSGKAQTMLRYALIFLVVALVAGLLGFGGIAGAAAGIAKILFYIFIILFVVGLVMHLVRGGSSAI